VNPSRPPRVVIDTNVLLDFWIFDDPAARPLRTAIEQRHVVALRSDALVAEFADVLLRSKFALSTDRQMEILRHWNGVSTAAEVNRAAPFLCTDPDDQKFLDLAFSAKADWLVTKDKALLRLGRRADRHNLAILRPDDVNQRLSG
jgi:uncharacterized protein